MPPEHPDEARRPPIAVGLDDIPGLPGPDTLTWHPVRARLGLRAFGTNAYSAAEVGRDVVEPHSEDPSLAHEELYFVARGRATFTVDDRQIDAPAGTYVFVPDPRSRRHAIAAEPDTWVLSFGGPPTFTPSAWEWAWRAAAVTEEDPGQAREILAEGLRAHPESPSVHYGLACLEAREDNRDAALKALAFAIERRPQLAAVASADADLAALRDDPRFAELTSRQG